MKSFGISSSVFKPCTVSLLFAALGVQMQAQRIDFDMTGRQTKEVTETGYTSWQVDKGANASKTVQSDDGRQITITVDCGKSSATDRILKANWAKAITQQNTKLVGDAIVLYGYDGDNTPHLQVAGTMNITLKGLSAGEHSILLYLNMTDGNMTSSAPLSISINGEEKMSGIQMTAQAKSTDEATQAYLTFPAADGEAVKVSITSKPEDGKEYVTTGVYVNALVLDRPNPKASAINPYPANADLHADADGGEIVLRWEQGNPENTNIIYIGEHKDNLTLLGESAEPQYAAKGLSTHNTYYWRVDQRDASGNIIQGDVWHFRPRRPAFPGAEGYGRFAIGGRGGTVYHVTSLDDTPSSPQPGTFRYGIEKVSGPRTIVFDISGTIFLKSRLTISSPYVTIAGQTAPGGGILFRGSPIGTGSDNIMRFVRMLRGWHNDDPDDYNRGCDGIGMAGNDHTIIDHCSTGWTIDEAFSSRGSKNITLQRTILSEALNNANHPNYPAGESNHGFAATIGGDTASFHHNLLAHNEGRNWSLAGALDGNGYYAGHMDIFNNVVYNWGGRATDGGTHEGNFVNNYYKMGPATTQKYLLRAQLEGVGKGSQSYYVSGNIRENNDGSKTRDKEGVTYKYELSNNQVLDWEVWSPKPFFPSYATIESAELAYKTVLSDVGPNQPFLNAHDERMVSETLSRSYKYKGSVTGKKGLIDREGDAGGFETIAFEQRPATWDSDRDGMPDWWEKATYSDPNVANNNDDPDNNGYTNLEEYLNWTGEPHYFLPIDANAEHFETAARINLKPLFRGFDNNPAFTASKVYLVDERIDLATTECNPTISDGVLNISLPAVDNLLLAVDITATDDDNAGSMTRRLNLLVTTDKTLTGIENITSLTSSDPNTVYTVYTINGTMICQGKSLNENINSLAPGIYIIRSSNAKSANSFKYVKK